MQRNKPTSKTEFDSVGIKPCASINSTSFAGISFFDNSGALAKLHNTTETVDCHNHIDSPARGVFGLSTSQPNAVYAQNGLVLKSNGKQSFGFVGFSFKADVNRYALDEPFAFIRVKGFDVCGQEVAHLTKSFKGKNYGFSDAVAFDVQDSAEPFTDLDKVQIDFWWIWIDGPTVINRPLQNAMVDDIKLIVKRS
ncbi:hypothetical protein HK098_003061 [Nowakowskiella sp. JEL0407]|nr:hypothetical protein HK098_003061 [Nowakowskiella sp. JEL0407]